LVNDIARAAVEQSSAAEIVTHTMEEVAAIADKTSTSATGVSTSFRNLLAVARELQASVGQFKVD
jgi:methyl-accepting chemotaxis protein PixJ